MIFLEQFALHAEAAVFEKFLQVDEHPLADDRDGQDFLGFADDVFDLLGIVFDGLGGVAIRADAEGILSVNFQQVRGLVEDVGDRLVVHGLKIKQDWDAVPAAESEKGGTEKTELLVRPRSSCTAVGGGESSWAASQALLVTLAACGPFWPSLISNSTVSPSCRLL